MKTSSNCVLSGLLFMFVVATCRGEFVLDDFDVEFSLQVPNESSRANPHEYDLGQQGHAMQLRHNAIWIIFTELWRQDIQGFSGNMGIRL